jgi:murein L,D-transpeptidase YcbB/YkuD
MTMASIAWRRLLLAAAASMLLAASPARAAPAPEQIGALAAEAARAPRDARALFDERNWLERFYSARAFAPAWTGANAANAARALDLLHRADEHGLAPSDYASDALARQRDAALAAAGSEAARFDTALTLSMLRYLADLHAGRTRAGFQHPVPDPRVRDFDPVAVLQRALAGQQLGAAIDAAEPQSALYRRLKTALAQYRALATRPLPALPALPAGRRALEPGDAFAGAPSVAARLAMLGDLAPELAATQDERYGPELAAAIERFQERHGLGADGLLGRQTLLALAVPPGVRVRQIELSMERLRWLPDLSGGPVIAINLPSFYLWAFEAGKAQPALQMRVIVGKAVRNPTPLFIGDMRYLEFNPYWNVPRSIERGEILPKLAKDPDYLAKNDMELVGARGAVSDTVDAATLAALRAGALRVRQRPGPANALGAIKFALPNAMDIYLHSTPARALFQRSRRDFSHGCIRVEDPAALAQFVLAGQDDWSAEAIAAAMTPGPTRTVKLARPVPVVIFYTTAIIDRDGRALFPADVYRLDEALERALAARATGRN